MIEVACTVCGASYRFSEMDVPLGGATVVCAQCKTRIVVQVPPPPPAMMGGTGDVIDLGGPDSISMPLEGAEIVDLPAPKLAAPEPGVEIIDLPAPRLIPRSAAEPMTLDNIDLLAPVGPTRSRPPAPAPMLADVPQIPRTRTPRPGAAAIPDLPAPKRAAEPARQSFKTAPPPFASPHSMPTPPPARSAAQLEGPGAPADLPDLPTPKYGGPARDLFDDLPSRGPSLADLPTPKRASTPAPSPTAAGPTNVTDLPAPKGFFDDLPRPAPKPANPQRPDLPAPKGFFDDLPQPANPQRPDLPAPKGFFDDLPQPASQQRSDLPAPKGFFDDLPQPGYAASGVELPVPRDFFDDAPQRSRAPLPGSDGGLDRLDGLRATAAAPPLDLGDDNLSGLDLPAPDAGPSIAATRTGVVSFSGRSDDGGPEPRTGSASGGLNELDLAAPPRKESTSQTIARRPEVALPPDRRKLKRVAAIAALAVALAGTGGYLAYDRWQTKKARVAATERSLATAHKALLAGDQGHWGRALTAAKEVLSRSPKNAEALATAALAQLAGVYDQGTNRDARIKAGRGLVEQARLASATGPTMNKALALDVLIEGDPRGAIDRLTPMIGDDPEAVLYLGWAQLAAQRWDEASATFTKAAEATPGRKLTATYGRAQALLGKGDLDAARADFLAVIAVDAEHVGAQVGVAAAMPAADFLKQETELLAILQRPKIESADPRVRALAWKLAGNDARSAGRLDAARERYRKALELMPNDVGTLVAAAALEVRDGKLENAATGIDQALTIAADDIDANLVKVELDLRNQQLDLAATRIKALRDRNPPISGAAPRGQLELLDGQRLAAAGDNDGAIVAYGKAREILGTGDIAPTIAIATLLGKMAAAAATAGKTDDAATLRVRATGELAALADAATADPGKAVTLGVAYLEANNLVEAETWLRLAVAARPTDVEAHFQLAECLRRAGKTAEAITTLKESYDLAPTRVDLGVALARADEAAGRDADAAQVYEALLKDDDPDDPSKISIDVRTRAGRFYARLGQGAKAGEQGAAILKIETDNPAGRFLKGEGLLAAGKVLEARQELQRAADRDPDPQYLDGLGRANEAQFLEKNDTAARDEALRAYEAATARAPTMVHAWAAAGRMYKHRQQWEQAIKAFQNAYALTRTAELAGEIGQCFAQLKQNVEAIRWLKVAAAGAPSGETLNTLATLYFDDNRRGDAAREYVRAIALGVKDEGPGKPKVPWLDDAYFNLGVVSDQNDNFGAACKALNTYLLRVQGDPSAKHKADEARTRLLSLSGKC